MVRGPRLGWTLVVASSLALGCTEPPRADPPPAASGASSAIGSATGAASASDASTASPRCAEETASVSAWLGEVAAEGVLLPAPSKDLTPVAVEDPATPIPPGPHLEITTKEVLYDGQLAGKNASLAATASSLAAMAKKSRAALGEIAPGRTIPAISIDVDRAAPWSVVAEISKALASGGFDRVTFLLQAKSKVAAPPPSSVDAELGPSDALRLGPAAPIGPALDGKVFRDCIAVRDLLALVAGSGDAKAARVTKGLGAAMLGCDCNFDMAAARALIWAWYRRPGGLPRRGVAVPIARSGEDATELFAAAAAPWSETNAAVRAAVDKGKPVRLVIR